MLSVEVLVDLHAADVDEDRAAFPRTLESLKRFLQFIEVIGFAFDIHGEGLKAALAPRLGETDRIEDAFGYAELGCGRTDGALTGPKACRCLRRKADQGERRERR